MVYLDNGATSFPKPEEVYQAHDYAFRNFGANPGRGGHQLSRECARIIYKTREKVKKIINAKDSSEISFHSNTTDALNQAILGCISEGDHVLISRLEHNSVWRPMEWLKTNKRVEYDFCKHDSKGYIDTKYLKEQIKNNTKLIVVNHCSNVFGTMQDIYEIGRVARKNGVYLLVDGAQSLGFESIDVQEMCIDMLAFAGHKDLLGPMGTGGLYLDRTIKLDPIKIGGTGSLSESSMVPEKGPERYESGTMNTAGIYALGVGIDYITKKGIENIRNHKLGLVERIYKDLDGVVSFYGPNYNERRGGVVSLNIDDLSSVDVAYILDTVYGIEVRAGLHCSPLAHKFFGTLEQGTVRVSPGIFNTEEDVKLLVKAIKEIKES